MRNFTTSFKVIFTICFLSASHMILSQESNSKHVGGNPRTESKQSTTTKNPEVAKTKVSTNTNTTPASAQKQVDTQGKSFQLDENDTYQGRTEEFLSQIILKELPTDFPKYEKWMGVRHYNEVVSDYYKKHLDIVTPLVRQKLTQVH